jgi:preprotein translocase subunit SecA
LISKMLERAQAKVEGMHFEVRKNLLKYDDVMNDQRSVIYEQRKEIMSSESVEDIVKDMRYDVIENIVGATIPSGSYAEQWDTDSLHTECQRLLGLDLPIADWAKEEGIADEELLERILDAADSKMAKKLADSGATVWRQMEKSIVLQLLDQHWKEHLLNLDHLRQGINLRAFGQKNPLNEYKTEAFSAFENMLDMMRETITQTLSLVEINFQENDAPKLMFPGAKSEMAQTRETRNDPAMEDDARPQTRRNVRPMPAQPVKFDKNDPDTWGKTQRNAPCPCDSGKKYKHCHGKLLQEA